MRTVYLLEEFNVWFEYASREPLGVFSSPDAALAAARKRVEECHEADPGALAPNGDWQWVHRAAERGYGLTEMVVDKTEW